MSEYKLLMDNVPGLRDELPGVSERIEAIVKAELRDSFQIINSALDMEIEALVKKLDMTEDETSLMKRLVTQDLVNVNDEMTAAMRKTFDKLKE